jgi:MFS transporter, PPP family, 3-phenylpropionic acid transporter
VNPQSPSSVHAARLRAFYLLYYAGIGISIPFFAPYLRGLGFSGRQIGTAQMIGALTAAPAGIVWAVVTDRLRAPTRALQVATSGALLAALLLPWVRTPATVAAVLMLQGLAIPAVTPIVDGLAVETTRASGGYARLRLYGSLGYVVGALAMGGLLTARGDRPGDIAVPLGLCACALAYATTARGFSPAPSVSAPPRAGDLAALLRNRTLLWVVAAGALHAAFTVPYYQLFGVLVRQRGLPAAVTGTASTVGVLAEIALLFLYPRVERRFSPSTSLAVAFGAGTVRWALLSGTTSAAAIIGLQLFHALTFGLYWAATVRMLSHVVPAPLRTTGQAIYGALCFQVGGAIGSQLSGLAFDAFGAAAPVYRLAAVGELLPLAIALGLRRAAIDFGGANKPN